MQQLLSGDITRTDGLDGVHPNTWPCVHARLQTTSETRRVRTTGGACFRAPGLRSSRLTDHGADAQEQPEVLASGTRARLTDRRGWVSRSEQQEVHASGHPITLLSGAYMSQEWIGKFRSLPTKQACDLLIEKFHDIRNQMNLSTEGNRIAQIQLNNMSSPINLFPERKGSF
jgi:hypothetical protein